MWTSELPGPKSTASTGARERHWQALMEPGYVTYKVLGDFSDSITDGCTMDSYIILYVLLLMRNRRLRKFSELGTKSKRK